MSEFKVGDCVVYKDSNKYKNHLFKVVDVEDGIAIAIEAGQECFVYFPDMRLAKEQEIAAGHRIDTPTLPEPVGSLQELHPEFAKVLHENFLELLGDDFPIENHISPSCQSRDV